MELYSPVRAQACGLRWLQVSGGLCRSLQISRSPRVCVLLSTARCRAGRLRLAATRSWQKSFPFSGPQKPGRLPPPSLLAGPFPSPGSAAAAAATAGSEALVDAVLWRACPPSVGHQALPGSRTSPLRACAVPHEGAGLRFLSAAAAVAAAVSVR